jgi:hypothetical protein
MLRAIMILCVCWSCVASNAYGTPARVIIIRHGEKPDEGDDLSLKGRERASALVPFFQDSTNGVPAAIYAQGSSEKRPSRRAVQTVTPLAGELKLVVRTYHHSDFAVMTKEILAKPEYDGKIVLICWEHHGIPDIAAAMGVTSPPEWPGHAFDRLWIITFKNGKAKLSNAPQRLMFQDSPD